MEEFNEGSLALPNGQFISWIRDEDGYRIYTLHDTDHSIMHTIWDTKETPNCSLLVALAIEDALKSTELTLDKD